MKWLSIKTSIGYGYRINLENVSVVVPNTNTIFINSGMGSQDGKIVVDPESMRKILNLIDKSSVIADEPDVIQLVIPDDKSKSKKAVNTKK